MYWRINFYLFSSLEKLFLTEVHHNMEEHPRTFLARKLDFIYRSEKGAQWSTYMAEIHHRVNCWKGKSTRYLHSSKSPMTPQEWGTFLSSLWWVTRNSRPEKHLESPVNRPPCYHAAVRRGATEKVLSLFRTAAGITSVPTHLALFKGLQGCYSKTWAQGRNAKTQNTSRKKAEVTPENCWWKLFVEICSLCLGDNRSKIFAPKSIFWKKKLQTSVCGFPTVFRSSPFLSTF